MHCTRNVIVDNEINFSALFLKKCFSSVVQSWKRINKNKSYFANFVLSLYNKYKSIESYERFVTTTKNRNFESE